MRTLPIILFISICFSQVFAQETDAYVLSGIVLDLNGLPVPAASVEIISNSGETSSCTTSEQGKFSCGINSVESFSIAIRADGFSILRQTFANIQEFETDLTFTLEPAGIREDVSVTTNRTATRLAETPASIAIVAPETLATNASPALDDALRQTVGFTLFRRSNSRSANPTAQGTSLRGTNSSGGSRSLVLFDGIPVNDAFGGWIYWSRVPPIAVERIEVIRGGSSSLYGSDALGGTINIIPRTITDDAEDFTVSAEISGGTQNTFSASTYLGLEKDGWTADLVAGTFQTKGYKIIEEAARGAVDDFANSRNANLSGRFGRDFGTRANLFFKALYFGEARNNGTPVQKNRTLFRQIAFGGDFEISDFISQISDSLTDSKLNFRLYAGTQVFDQTFSAVADDRSSETLVRLQRVPSQNFGLSGQISTVFKNQTFLLGFEAQEVRGSTDEIGYFGGRATSKLGAGGRERTYGVFFQDFARIGEKLVLAGSLRFDRWKNFRALSSLTSLTGGQTTTNVFPDRDESYLSPGGAVLFQATAEIALYFNASRSFRAPTLNELYRGFRVGDVVTNPNEDLRAEKASNFEAGLSYGKRDFYIRGNFFRTEIADAISNVTIDATPSLITRQRRNAGKTRVNGLEIEAEMRVRNFKFSVGYLLADAFVAEFSSNRDLEGLRVPQVPLQQFTFQTRYETSKGWIFAVQGRTSSEQFDDDLNEFRLEPYFQLDAFAAKRLKEKWRIFVAVENVFNSRYSIGRTPVRTVSAPFGLRAGLRWK
jgi:outer membrane receptor protein involved in Fe transport